MLVCRNYNLQMLPYGAPHPDAVGAEANRRKFGGKELLTELGLNEYDQEARRHIPARCAFSQPDPLAGSLTDPQTGDKLSMPYNVPVSPYTFCNADPINLTDPTGLLFKRPKDAEKLKGTINDRIDRINNSIKKEEENRQKREDKGKSTEKNDKKINELNEQKGLLEKTLKTIEQMDADPDNVYNLKHTHENEHHVYKDKNGVIQIEFSDYSLAIHEITHIAQSLASKNGLVFDDNSQLKYASDNFSKMVDYEIEAYQTQYAISSSNMPSCNYNNVSYRDINAMYLVKLYDCGFSRYDFAKELYLYNLGVNKIRNR